MSSQEDGKDQGYLLGRSRLSSTRLTHQHLLWIDHFGWNLYPSATEGWYAGSVGKEEERKIADVACGNAIWLITEARLHPQTTKFTGLDISSAQFPPISSLPSNITLENYDIFQPPPEKFHSYFDVIYVRLLIGVIRASPVPVLHNVVQMLKPGGTLQWGEVHAMNSMVFPNTPETAHVLKAMNRLTRMIMGPDNEDGTHWLDWANGLAGIFRESGLFEEGGVVEVRGGDPKPGMWRYWNNNDCGAWEEVCHAMGRKELVEAFHQVEELMVKEEVLVHFEPVIAVGRKK